MVSVATGHRRMVAGTDYSHIQIRLVRQPSPGDPGLVLLDLDLSVSFTAELALSGTPGESVTGWKIGFIQLKHITTEWAEYRGLSLNDGSIFAAMDRPPARMQQLCLDCPSTHRPFYGDDVYVTLDPNSALVTPPTDSTVKFAPGGAIPPSGLLQVQVCHGDAPDRHYEIALLNTSCTPQRMNYLHSLESRAAFVTLLAAQDPQGHYHFVKHMYWNVNWQAQFRWNSTAQLLEKTSESGGVNIQRQSHDGIPADPRFASSLLGLGIPGAGLPLCNLVKEAAFRHPGRLRYARQWQMWRVGR